MSHRRFAHAVVYVALWTAWVWLCLPLSRGRFWGAFIVTALLIAHVDNDRYPPRPTP